MDQNHTIIHPDTVEEGSFLSMQQQYNNILHIALTGTAMGIFHVLSGPDHLSALATLSVGSSWKAMNLGIRWGMGHSAGLVVVALLFIVLKGEFNIRAISHYLNVFVGVFMITLGVHGMFIAVRERYFPKEEKIAKYHTLGDVGANVEEASSLLEMDESDDPGASGSDFDASPQDATSSSSSRNKGYIGMEEDLGDLESSRSHQEEEDFCKRYCCGGCCGVCNDLDSKDPVTQSVVAFTVGILHGIAGPGGLLGVLPAVEMKNWSAASIYLACFVVSSTLCMGFFAALYGETTKKLGDMNGFVEFFVNMFSCSLSLIVGVLWVVLSCMGKLEEFFED